MTNTIHTQSGCKMAGLLQSITRPWTLHILWALTTNGPQRFGELRRAVTGISARMLTLRLRELEESGFVYRDHKPTIPPQVTYGITPRMHELDAVFAQLTALTQKWQQP